jgi:hypothetical protein
MLIKKRNAVWRQYSNCLTPLVRFFFTFEPLEKIQDFNFLLKTNMKQVDESFLSIHAKFQPSRL